MRGNNNNSSCQYATPDSCVEYVGSAGSRLGINQGDSVGKVLDIIIGKLETLTCDTDLMGEISILADDLKDIQASSITTQAKLFGLTGSNTSSCAATIQNRSFTYSVDASDAGYMFTYSLSNTLDNLPDGIQHIDTNVSGVANVTSTTSSFVNSNKSTGGFAVRWANAPATIQFTIRLSSSCGLIELQQAITLHLGVATGDYANTLDVIDKSSTGTVETTQDKYNELLASKLALLESRIDRLGTFSDKTVIQSLEITELKEKVDTGAMVVFDDNTISLQDSIDQLIATNANLRSDVDILKSANDSLKSSIVGLGGSV